MKTKKVPKMDVTQFARMILEWSESRDGTPESDDTALRAITSLCEQEIEREG